MRHKYLVVLFISYCFALFFAVSGKAQFANPLMHAVSLTQASHKPVDLSDAIEDSSKRTLYSSTWVTKTGRVISRYSTAMLNYPDANGKLHPIDLTLHADSRGWVADKQPNPCYFHSDRSTEISLGNGLTFSCNKNCAVNGVEPDQQITSMQGNKVQLDLNVGVHKEIDFVPNGFKSTYVIDHALGGWINVSEEIEIPAGCSFVRDEKRGRMSEGSWHGDYILVAHDGTVLLRYQGAECYDAKKHWCMAGYNIKKENGKTILETVVPTSWLNNAVYPVTVDPLVVGTTSYWTGGSTVSCLYPKFHGDSILVTIPPRITITFFTADYAYISSTSVTYYIPINDGIFYLKTSCAKTDTASCADSPGGGDTAGVCYLVPNEDFHNPMTCCYGPSCSPQSFWLSAWLSRRHGGVGCDTSTIWYAASSYSGYQYYFSAWVEGYTDSLTSLSYVPTSQCSNNCKLTMTATMEYGVPPYTVSHPWAKRDTVVGAYNSCQSFGKAVMKLSIPGCPYTCGTSDTISVPPPTVVDACGDTIKNIPTKTVVLKPVPVCTVTPDTVSVCSGTPVTLTVNSCLPGTTFSWAGSDKFNGTGSTISDNTTDTGSSPMVVTYNVVGTLNGCSDTTKATGIIHPLPNVTISGYDTLTIGLSETITATGGVGYVWSPSSGLSCFTCPNPAASPTVTTTYTVQVTDSNGCVRTGTFTIDVKDEDIVIPNVITPNGDGKNDNFVIRNLELFPNSQLKIYDRWGVEIYTTANYKNDWNGGGHSNGVYYYVLVLPNAKKYDGFIQILNQK